ncbi:MAG: DUF1207 domain-containing protein [Pirellulales bacterium]|nr:DUF1207 domain-containing protein [Pirellulales bacterium]
MDIAVRQIGTATLAMALYIVVAQPSAHAQGLGEVTNLPPITFATPTSIYASPSNYARLAGDPIQTAYDDQNHSVLILDGPIGVENVAPGLPTIAQPPNLSPTVPLNSYSTIGPPALPGGMVVPDATDYSCEPWHWQLLPYGLIWHSYLAGPEEPRMAAILFNDPNLGTKFDGQLGARIGLLRYGTGADFRPNGWQIDVEGAAFIRQDPEENSDVDGYDFRVGVPLTSGWGRYQMKVAWYHTSSHLGDEFALKHPEFVRINYSRNAIVWGHSYYLLDELRLYGEIDYGYWTDGGNEPWAFQFGFEYSPLVRGARGAPFLAVNGLLRQENDFGGPFTLETGWQWRPLRGGQLLRVGFHYQTGPSILNEFYLDSEQQVGGGIWYDF